MWTEQVRRGSIETAPPAASWVRIVSTTGWLQTPLSGWLQCLRKATVHTFHTCISLEVFLLCFIFSKYTGSLDFSTACWPILQQTILDRAWTTCWKGPGLILAHPFWEGCPQVPSICCQQAFGSFFCTHTRTQVGKDRKNLAYELKDRVKFHDKPSWAVAASGTLGWELLTPTSSKESTTTKSPFHLWA